MKSVCNLSKAGGSKFKVILSYIVCSRPSWATWDHTSKKTLLLYRAIILLCKNFKTFIINVIECMVCTYWDEPIFQKVYFIFINLYVCYVCGFVHVSAGAIWSQKRALNPLELGKVVSHLMWELEIRLRSSERAAPTLNLRATSPAHV